jgi:hypothetical protein
MNFYPLKPDEIVTVCKIASDMAKAKLPSEFIAKAVQVAWESKSGFDILMLWQDADTQEFKDRVVMLLEKFFEDLEDFESTKIYESQVKSVQELDELTQKIMDYKKWLRSVMDKWGGVSKLAKTIGVSQPSMSDFFLSASVPKKVTVDKIANALHLNDENMYPNWLQK